MSKKVVIIGAGIAGLSAGCYARMNGYEAEIYETHTLPGGLCTSWKRKGYTIDGSLDYLMGTRPQSVFYTIWQELGAIQGCRVIDLDVFERASSLEGKTFSVYCDADKLEAHMKEFSPEDSETIELLCRLIRRYTKVTWPIEKAFELYNVFDIISVILKMMPVSKEMNLCNNTSMAEFAQRFKDPFLRETFPKLLLDDQPLVNIVSALAAMHSKGGGILEGGALEFARRIENRFLNLGGRVYFGKKVDEILEDGGRADGIRLTDGEEIKSDYVISAADLHNTLYGMLKGKHVDPMHEEIFRTCRLFPSALQVSFGLSTRQAIESDCVLGESFRLNKPIKVGNQDFDSISFKSTCYDPTLAPDGKTVIKSVFMVNDFKYWQKLLTDRNAYRAEKERIATAVANEMDGRYPGFKSAIEVVDVATPTTYERYAGTWHGAFMTWVFSPAQAKRFRVVKKTVPGLDDFWLCGMWVQPPGGTPAAAMAARHVIQLMCRKDRKGFQTSIPADGRNLVPMS